MEGPFEGPGVRTLTESGGQYNSDIESDAEDTPLGAVFSTSEGIPHPKLLPKLKSSVQDICVECALRDAAPHPKLGDIEDGRGKWLDWQEIDSDYGVLLTNQGQPGSLRPGRRRLPHSVAPRRFTILITVSQVRARSAGQHGLIRTEHHDRCHSVVILGELGRACHNPSPLT